MANTGADRSAPKAGDSMAGMAHSEVHYFNSYNHHGIHEEMLVGSPAQLSYIGGTGVDLIAERRSANQVVP